MSEVWRFTRLDLLTMKPYLKVATLLVYLCTAAFVAVTGTFSSAGATIAVVFAIIYAGYPFAVAETSNLDGLYATLAVPRRTAVLGRFAFSCLFMLAAVLAGSAVDLAFLAWRHGSPAQMGVTALALLAVALLVACIQLPVYFKLGYSRAKAVAPAVMMVLVILFLVPVYLWENSALPDAVPGLPLPALVGAALAVEAGLVVASVALSIRFYRAREF
jgi:hypothetical protein